MEDIGTKEDFIQYLKLGNLDMGMPAFGDTLSDSQIRTLQIFIEEMRQKNRYEGNDLVGSVQKKKL